jgi:HD-like signal output (HDOD) protein
VNSSSDIDVLRQVCRRECIPLPAPGLALALELSSDLDIEDERLIEHCDHDPRLSFALLVGANCGLFSGSHVAPIKSVAHAVARLGRDRACSMLWVLALSDLLQRVPGAHPRAVERLWRHSLQTAVIAEQLVRERDATHRAIGLASGMAHDVGHVLLHRDRTPVLAVFDDEVGENRDGRHLPDHCQVGAALLSLWNAPESLVAAARHHHAPGEAGKNIPLVALVRLADLVAGQLERETPVHPVSLRSDPVWRELAVLASNHAGEEFDRRVVERLPEAMLLAEHLARVLGV